jgi:hypothetical protein
MPLLNAHLTESSHARRADAIAAIDELLWRIEGLARGVSKEDLTRVAFRMTRTTQDILTAAARSANAVNR